ncbi:MAG: hypothetical protein R6W97_00200 [Thiobacillus sp.]
MTELFEMLSAITLRRATEGGTPFATLKATERWLKRLPSDSDYDAHHALVQGLERFNAEHDAASLSHMKSLVRVEEAGMPLQRRVVEQYVRNQGTFRLARQALWRETWAFWSLLSEAWLKLLKAAYRGPASAELRPYAAEIATRALRYTVLAMRWDYHQARNPGASAWRRMHKVYRLVERDSFANQEVIIDSRPTHCAREYTLGVLMGLVHPVGFRPQHIEAIAQILEGYGPLPLPSIEIDPDGHTHRVDLSHDEGACVLDNEWQQGSRLRYFALQPLVDHLRALDQTSDDGIENKGLTRQMASLIERGGINRNRERTNRFGRVWVATGMDNIMAALANREAAGDRPPLESWTLRDESAEGMGFDVVQAQTQPNGHLVAVSWNPSETAWQLLAIRWNREEDGHHLVGTQRLSRHPKRVRVWLETDAPEAAASKDWALFLPMAHEEQGSSNLLMPRSHYRLGAILMLLDGDIVYRLRLGEVLEGHEGWLRVGMEVVGRERFAEAA